MQIIKGGNTLTEKLIHLDIVSLIILAIILLSQLSRKMYKGSTNRFFISLIVLTMLSACTDIWATVLDNMNSPDIGLRMAAHSIDLLVYNAIPPFFLMYVISLTFSWSKLTSNKFASILFVIPYAADLIITVVNLFTGCVFRIDSGIYHTDTMVFIPYFSAGIYIAISIAYLVRYRKFFTLTMALALLFMIPVMIGIVIIRLITPELMVMVFANTVGLMLISVMIQRPESVIDNFTGLKIYNAYAEDVRKNFIIGNRIGIIMINIENYSSLYKMLGYDRTRMLLQKVTRSIRECNTKAKAHATAYYLDQGRFRLVINSYNLDTMNEAAELINNELRKPIRIDKSELNLLPYICVVNCPEDIQSFRALMSFGVDFHDKLPYRGEVIHANDSSVKNTLSLLTDVDDIIERAFTNHSFKVYYQPIYSIQKKKFVSAEALLRLIDEKKGFISPEVFIPAAEKSGAIHKIGDFVMEEVCRFIGSDEYKRLGLEYIEINLSVSQCMRHGLSEHILKIMQKYGVTSDQVNLEITETAASYDQNVMAENLSELNSAGISFSLDDYGTGYSNMYRIAALPLKIVKLDKTFVNNQNSKMWTILQNTVRMIKDLNMEIVVEGVETEDMVNKFSDLKCDFIQGFYFSKPVPQNEFVEFIKKKNK